MKKIFLCILVLVGICYNCSVVNAQANDEMQNSNITKSLTNEHEKFLLEKGIDIDFISDLDETMLQLIYDNSIANNESFNGLEKSRFITNTRSTLSEDDFSHNLLLWNSYDSDGNLEYIRVEVISYWKVYVHETLEDINVVSWDDSNFRYVDNSACVVSYATHSIGNLSDYNVNKSLSDIGSNFVQFGAKKWTDSYVSNYTTFKIKPKFDIIESGEIQIYSKYVHKMYDVSVSVNVGSLGNVTISGDNIEQVAVSNSISYNPYNLFGGADSYHFGYKTIIRQDNEAEYLINDDYSEFGQKFDIINFNKYYGVDVKCLKNLGYKYLSFRMNIYIKEIDDGYQHIHLYSSLKNSNDYLITSSDKISGTSSYSLYIFEFYNIDISKIDENLNSLYIRYSASGFRSDDWVNKNLRVSMTASKNTI